MKYAKLLVRKTLKNTLGTVEDKILDQIESMDLDAEDKARLVKHNQTIDTGFAQMISVITFALEAHEAVFDTSNATFVYEDTGNGYVTRHNIAFNDMVMLHNSKEYLPEVVRIIPKVFLTRVRGDVVCLKHRLNLSTTA